MRKASAFASLNSALERLGALPLARDRDQAHFLWQSCAHGALCWQLAMIDDAWVGAAWVGAAWRRVLFPPLGVERCNRLVSADAAEAFFSTLDHNGFWALPVGSGNIGLDGAEWTLGVVRGSRRHLIREWSPHGGAFVAACFALATAVESGGRRYYVPDDGDAQLIRRCTGRW